MKRAVNVEEDFVNRQRRGLIDAPAQMNIEKKKRKKICEKREEKRGVYKRKR